MKNSTIRIVAAVLDTSKLTLYKTDGTTTVLSQGDPRIRRIIDESAPQIIAHGYAEIQLEDDESNPYKEFEEKSTKVRFFRVAKDKLKRFFGLGSEPREQEAMPSNLQIGAVSMPAPTRAVDMVPVLAEIMEHATPAKHEDFTEKGLDRQAPITENGVTPSQATPSLSSDTIIAVTDQGSVIPGMERIKNQFARAARLGSTAGVERFLERLGKVIHERRHSIEELLKFMERGDLPIADDGCILIYKVLNKQTSSEYPSQVYADCHTGKVPQWIGARVQMDEKLVDPSRRLECSNGLHVARRGYISSFSGNVCTLCKVAPEDVIAVPEGEANKMRVCGYNILFELSEEQHRLVRSHKPLTEDAAGRIMLADALAGRHTRVTHIVEITGNLGQGIKIRKVDPPQNPPAAPVAPEPAPEPVPEAPAAPETAAAEEVVPEPPPPIEEAEALKDAEAEALDNPINPREVVKTVENLTHKEHARQLVASIQAETDPEKLGLLQLELLQVKRASKYSWDRLNVPTGIAQMIDAMTPPVSNGKVVAAPKLNGAVPPEPASEGESRSFIQRIAKLAAITPMNHSTATAILNLKKQSKKGWSALKVSDPVIAEVERLTGTAK